MLALTLYPIATSSAVGLLVCEPISVTHIAAASFDGGPAASANTAASFTGMITVDVLTNNNYFVCWAGSHRPAGILAIVVLVAYVAAVPVITLFWAWRVVTQIKAAASLQDKVPEVELLSRGIAPVLKREESSADPWDSTDPIVLPIVSDYSPSAW